jgi:hypothetical protein
MRKIAVSALLGSLALAIACSDSTPAPNSGSSGTASSSSSSGMMASSSGMMASSSSSGMMMMDGGSDAGPAATCTKYCADIKTNCTGATNVQYVSDADCMESCLTFPAGTAGATSGNSLACRAYHVGAAAAAPATHCAHANAFGGREGEESCGDRCDNFCQLAVATCATQFPTAAACKTACTGWGLSTTTNKEYGNQAVKGGNSYNCRAYHLTAALTDPVGHCGHTVGGAGTPCN